MTKTVIKVKAWETEIIKRKTSSRPQHTKDWSQVISQWNTERRIPSPDCNFLVRDGTHSFRCVLVEPITSKPVLLQDETSISFHFCSCPSPLFLPPRSQLGHRDSVSGV